MKEKEKNPLDGDLLVSLPDRILKFAKERRAELEVGTISLLLIWITSFLIIINYEGSIDPHRRWAYILHSLIQVALISATYLVSIQRIHASFYKIFYKYLLFVTCTYLLILFLSFTLITGSLGMVWVFSQPDIYLVSLRLTGVVMGFFIFYMTIRFLLKILK